jgi:hypothetical protein
MKRSAVLYAVLFIMFLGIVITGFAIPQEVLNENELIFLLVVMPIMGWMWIQAYIDGTKGN